VNYRGTIGFDTLPHRDGIATCNTIEMSEDHTLRSLLLSSQSYPYWMLEIPTRNSTDWMCLWGISTKLLFNKDYHDKPYTGRSRAPDFETKSYNVIYIYSLLVGFDKSALSHHVLIPKSYSSTDTGLH